METDWQRRISNHKVRSLLLILSFMLTIPTLAGPLESVEMETLPTRSPIGPQHEVIAPVGLRMNENHSIEIHTDHFGMGAPPRRYRRSPTSALELPIAIAPELADLHHAANLSRSPEESDREVTPLSEEMKIAPIPEPTPLVLVGVGVFCYGSWRLLRWSMRTGNANRCVDL